MKTLVLMRHAEPETQKSGSTDFMRNLTERGRKDVDSLTNFMRTKEFFPDQIVSSPAQRTRNTAEIIASKLSYPVNEIHYEQFLYEFYDKDDIIGLLKNCFEDKNSVLIVGHNPLIAYLANELTGQLNQFPAGKALGIAFQTESWDIKKGEIIFSFENSGKGL